MASPHTPIALKADRPQRRGLRARAKKLLLQFPPNVWSATILVIQPLAESEVFVRGAIRGVKRENRPASLGCFHKLLARFEVIGPLKMVAEFFGSSWTVYSELGHCIVEPAGMDERRGLRCKDGALRRSSVSASKAFRSFVVARCSLTAASTANHMASEVGIGFSKTAPWIQAMQTLIASQNGASLIATLSP
jgi:hypothetical protein